MFILNLVFCFFYFVVHLLYYDICLNIIFENIWKYVKKHWKTCKHAIKQTKTWVFCYGCCKTQQKPWFFAPWYSPLGAHGGTHAPGQMPQSSFQGLTCFIWVYIGLYKFSYGSYNCSYVFIVLACFRIYLKYLNIKDTQQYTEKM